MTVFHPGNAWARRSSSPGQRSILAGHAPRRCAKPVVSDRRPTREDRAAAVGRALARRTPLMDPRPIERCRRSLGTSHCRSLASPRRERGGVIDIMTRHEIQVLRAAGIPERAVAEQTAVSVRSMERISEEPPVRTRIRTTQMRRLPTLERRGYRLLHCRVADRAQRTESAPHPVGHRHGCEGKCAPQQPTEHSSRYRTNAAHCRYHRSLAAVVGVRVIGREGRLGSSTHSRHGEIAFNRDDSVTATQCKRRISVEVCPAGRQVCGETDQALPDAVVLDEPLSTHCLRLRHNPTPFEDSESRQQPAPPHSVSVAHATTGAGRSLRSTREPSTAALSSLRSAPAELPRVDRTLHSRVREGEPHPAMADLIDAETIPVAGHACCFLHDVRK